MALAAWRGREREAAALIEAKRAGGHRSRCGQLPDFADYASVVLYNGVC